MNITGSLKDILGHTYSLGFIDMVKIIGTTADARIEAMDNDKTVIMYGNLYQPIDELSHTVGLTRLGVLKGYLDYQAFSNEGAHVNVIKQTRDGAEIPVELEFSAGNNKSNYRFMAEAVVNEQIRVPPFKGATWNAVINPSAEALQNLSYFANILGSYETTFIVRSEKGLLYFDIGAGTNDRSTLHIADGITGSLRQWAYPLNQVLAILKLRKTGDCRMSFSDMGALKIDIDSGVGKYEYILPARQ